MPFKSVNDLKNSDLFRRMDSLKTMGDTKLEKFVNVFNGVFERVRRNGGTEDEAESTAVPLALSAARRASIVNQRVEDEVHFVAAHMPEQFTANQQGFEAAEFDFSIVDAIPDVVDEAVAGNLFTHGHGGPSVGVIRGIVPRGEAPQEVQEKADPDTPFLFKASYFEDTADRVREMKGVSAEWASIPLDNGKKLAFPGSFVVTESPLNPPYTGIRMVAGHGQDAEEDLTIPSVNVRRLYSEDGGMGQEMTGDTGIEDLSDEELREKVREQQASLEELQEEKDQNDNLQEEMASIRETVAGLEEAVGKEPDAEESVEERIAALESDVKTRVEGFEEAKERIASLEQQQRQREAEAWAEENLAGRVPTEEWSGWINKYMEDPDGTEDLVASIPKGLLGDDDPDADSMPDEDQAAIDEQIDEALGMGENGEQEVNL